MVFFLRFRRSVSRSILSMLSLRFLASCSACSLPSRSVWDSFAGGWRATARGSDIERRRPEGVCMVPFMMGHSKEHYAAVQGLLGKNPRRRASWVALLYMHTGSAVDIRKETESGTPFEKLAAGVKCSSVRVCASWASAQRASASCR